MVLDVSLTSRLIALTPLVCYSSCDVNGLFPWVPLKKQYLLYNAKNDSFIKMEMQQVKRIL